MPRFSGRPGGKPNRRRNVPAFRIHTSHKSETAVDPSEATDGDLREGDQALQANDQVPHSSGEPGESPALVSMPDDLDLPDEPSLEDYIERIESSAARLRAEHSGDAAVESPAIADAETDQMSGRSLRRNRPGRRRRKARPTEPPKAWYRRRRTWLIVAMVLPLLLVAGATAYVLNIVRVSVDAYGDIHEDPISDRTRYTVNTEGTPVPVPSAQVEQILPNWENDDPINIVLLGVDAQTSDDQPPRSDTTIVMHIDPATDKVAMMSIPRDLIVYIPGFGEDKFNAAYPIGEAHKDEIAGGGPTLVAQTIEANFNIPIHYYATINFEGFRDVVDTVGGVVIDVDTQLSDNLYPTDDLRLTRVYFAAGLQKMDGETALEYVRTRHADSDFGRAERQQQVLLAIRQQAVSLELITQAQSLIRDMQHTIRTDLNFNQMLALANLGRQVQPDSIAKLNLFEEGLLTEHLPEYEGDAYYIDADWQAVLDETRAFFGGGRQVADSATSTADAEPDLSISVFVENATNIPLLAGSSAQILADAGFLEVWPSDARRPQSQSTIQVAPGEIATARHIARLLGFSDSAIVTVTGTDGITVTLGEDVPSDLIPDPDAEPVAG